MPTRLTEEPAPPRGQRRRDLGLVVQRSAQRGQRARGVLGDGVEEQAHAGDDPALRVVEPRTQRALGQPLDRGHDDCRLQAAQRPEVVQGQRARGAGGLGDALGGDGRRSAVVEQPQPRGEQVRPPLLGGIRRAAGSR
ncbi:hypothetical protein GCM10025868_23860 [Angustibacter aerolatus]|uniref:Uncharacterized protein n=1 Tax=Angustibacter aerolatus TaxID=1162965 RepID=A0ABQ6JHX7_9ACTN|nr:hypothetical protein [Angustibacter aerolatus]GMA87136.1 hypothetical protein GCM10025868_23860 [Angustibacter aerolatus]